MPDVMQGATQIIAGGRAAVHALAGEKWWIDPDGSCEDVSIVRSIVTPAQGTQTLVVQFDVPDGFQFSLRGVLAQYDGEGFINGSGALIFVLDVNRPIGGTARQGYAVSYFESVQYLRGNNEDWWPLAGRRVFNAGETLRWKVTTADPIPVGGGNYITAGLFGWTRPIENLGVL
jgi:hypothetical protein